MNCKLKILITGILFLFLSVNSFAAKRYWVGTTDLYWGTTSPHTNWATTSGGSTYGSVPGANDTAYFDGNGSVNDTLDANISVKRIEIANTYSATIIQGGKTITIGTSGAVFSGGTFSGGSASITVSGPFTISGCTFTSTSGTFSTSANFTFSSGSFTHNGGTVTLTATSTFTVSKTGGATFYNLTFAPTAANATFTITSTTTITVSHLLTEGGTKDGVMNGGTIHIGGNITITNTVASSGGGTLLLVIDGSGTQTITGTGTGNAGYLPKVTITKSSSDTLKILSTVSAEGNWTYNSGIMSASTSLIVFNGSPTITGTHRLGSVQFVGQNAYTIASGDTLIVGGTLYLGTGGLNPILNTGVISTKGNIDYSASTSSANGGGSATILIDGTGSQSLLGSTTSTASRICNVKIKKTSGTLTISDKLTVIGNWTYSSGTIDPTTSTLLFSGNRTITGTHALYNVTFNGSAASIFTIASGDTLTISGTMRIESSSAVTINTGTIQAQGNITLANTSTSTGGSASLVINGPGSQTLTGNSTAGTCKLISTKINKSSGTLSLVSTISVGGNWTYTTGTISPGSSNVAFYGSKTIAGSHTLGDVTFDGGAASVYKIATGTTLTATGTLNINGTAAVTIDSGTVAAQGNIKTTNTSSGGGGSATIYINGIGSQTFTGSGIAGQGRFPKITIDKSSGTLTLASVISAGNDWTYVQGTVDASTNLTTVDFYGSLNLDGQGTSTTMSFYNAITAAGTITLTGNVNVSNDLTINSSTTLAAGSNTLSVGGNWSDNGTWTFSTSTVTFNGSGYHTIAKASGTETFYNLGFNLSRSNKTQTLNNPVKVNNLLNMTKGRVKTTTTNVLRLIDNASLSGGSDSSYVQGPIQKIGNDAFTFPVGDTSVHSSGAYHPLTITAPSSTGDTFAATYFASAQSYGATLVSGDTAVSSCEYWTLKRSVGSSSTPTVSLTWNSNCDNTGFSEMTELLWNGSQWNDLGQASVTIANSKSGTLAASSAASFTVNPAPITIGYKTVKKSFSLLSKTLDGGFYTTDGNELYFGFDEEYQDGDGILSYSIRSLSNDQVVTLLGNSNNTPAVSYGHRQYRIDLYNNSNVPLSSGYYMLEVTNEKNEKWYLRFKI